MNKKIIAASLIAASTSMMAMDLQYFLGAGAERTDTNGKVSGSDGFNEKDEFKDTDLLLKAGIILDNVHRVSISHSKYSKGYVDITRVLGNYDYLIPINDEFRVYTGLHAGNAKTEVRSDDEGKVSFSGLAYGVQAGGIYDITKNIELELGLSYTKLNVDRAEDATWYRMELEDSTSMFAGLNYKF